MPTWGYSFVEGKYDADRLAKASGRDVRVKPKHAREICAVIKGMKVDQAKEFLEKVIRLEQSVPFRRYKKKTAQAGSQQNNHIKQEKQPGTGSDGRWSTSLRGCCSTWISSGTRRCLLDPR